MKWSSPKCLQSQRNTEIQWLYVDTLGIEKIGNNFGMRSGNKGRDKPEMTTENHKSFSEERDTFDDDDTH